MSNVVVDEVSRCFPALRQLRSIHRSVRQPVLLSLVTSLILTRLDYSSASLFGVPGHLLNRLQSVLNAAARLACHAQKYDHVTHLLCDLHWFNCVFQKEYISNWQFLSSVVVTTWRLRTSPVTSAGPTSQKRYNAFVPALANNWLCQERDFALLMTVHSVWRRHGHGTVFLQVSLQQIHWLCLKDNWKYSYSITLRDYITSRNLLVYVSVHATMLNVVTLWTVKAEFYHGWMKCDILGFTLRLRCVHWIMPSYPSTVLLILFSGELVEWHQTARIKLRHMAWRHALCAGHNSSPWILLSTARWGKFLILNPKILQMYAEKYLAVYLQSQ